MNPQCYYPDSYFRDLDTFREVSSGSSLELCPLTLDTYLKDARLLNDISLDCFFVSQYCLNLIAQGVHSYFPRYRFNAVDYLDVQGCYSHSFRSGDFSRPIDLIYFLKKYRINISVEMLNQYAEYFLKNVLPEYLPGISASMFAEALINDLDCVEVHPSLRRIVESDAQVID